ncbi:NAD(P)H-dependent oxidoreductase [Microvirga puerhi]|uniref:NAD(P)H-dependent oxidoreductase n=1 Tax=Microvirga puerhi TaxID=2876078 RepID=A0ABS7VJK6_9HYPH|nr:NAD(P)H-dependent oxidoreductase [Microvirga puerhi]MBZ6075340.1 NAD(P)H-dependent oxidoreductase [Microvirga puerhi]
MPKIVAISGSPTLQSRTSRLVSEIQIRIAQETGASARMIDIAEIAPELTVRSRADASALLIEALRDVERTDLLIVGSPVYNGSYTGLFKAFIDLVDYKSLIGVPVALLATGGTDRHAMVIDHQFRPLFGFFNAQVLPTGVFVSDSAYRDGRIQDALLQRRLSHLVREGVAALRARSRVRNSSLA